MGDKLRELMNREGLKSSQLAEMLGINPAGISHILAGRNKPGFDLLQKILRRFPRINPDWLLLDAPEMYRAERPASAAPLRDAAASRGGESRSVAAGHDLFTAVPVSDDPQRQAVRPEPSDAQAVPGVAAAGRRIARVVVCYDDGTFDAYGPSQARYER